VRQLEKRALERLRRLLAGENPSAAA
jgi:hypothetical protein